MWNPGGGFPLLCADKTQNFVRICQFLAFFGDCLQMLAFSEVHLLDVWGNFG